jgi:phenylpyruvate tautomerase PptA (4-oxalocrotonate tautomerase family)
VKPSKAKVAARVEEIVQIILDGAEPHDLRHYVSEKEATPDTPWTLAEGEKGLSDRQIRRYAVAAEKVIAESCRTSRKRLMRRHLARRRNLYAKSVNSGDLRTALAVLADEARLLKLYDEAPRGKVDGEPPTKPAAVVAILAQRLAEANAAKMPEPEKAKLVAGVADTLLRAINAGDLSARIEVLEMVLKQRATKGKE